MTTPAGQLVVIAKEPRPGFVKTRLCPPCTGDQAAAIAEAALIDTLRAVQAASASRRVIAIDGSPGPWMPPGFEVIPQRGASLAERLAAAVDDCFEHGVGPVLIVAMDTPQVQAGHLERAASLLGDGHERAAVLGPATDGGYWLIGLSHPDPAAFHDVVMSVADTMAGQRQQLERCGFRVRLADVLRDVDTFDDAIAIAEEVPESSFGSAVRRTQRSHAAAQRR